MTPTTIPRRPALRGGRGTTALLVLVWAAWVLVPLVLAGAALASVVTFLGEQATPAEEAAADRLFAAAAVAAVCLPLAGTLLSVGWDRRGSAAAFGVALGVGLLVSVPVSSVVVPHRAPAATPSGAGGGCQEHSGGDTRCPGG